MLQTCTLCYFTKYSIQFNAMINTIILFCNIILLKARMFTPVKHGIIQNILGNFKPMVFIIVLYSILLLA